MKNGTGIIEMKELIAALENRMGLKHEVALDVARRVLNYFGFGDIIIDNMLNQEDRRLFYFLQDFGFMGTDWDETFLLNGRSWRIFYWRLNMFAIRKYSKAEEEKPREEIIEIYESLPDQAWIREGAV